MEKGYLRAEKSCTLDEKNGSFFDIKVQTEIKKKGVLKCPNGIACLYLFVPVCYMCGTSDQMTSLSCLSPYIIGGKRNKQGSKEDVINTVIHPIIPTR